MQKSFNKLGITIKLIDDTISIYDSRTDELLKSKTFKASDVVDRYNHLVEVYSQKETAKSHITHVEK